MRVLLLALMLAGCATTAPAPPPGGYDPYEVHKPQGGHCDAKKLVYCYGEVG